MPVDNRQHNEGAVDNTMRTGGGRQWGKQQDPMMASNKIQGGLGGP